MAEQGFANHTRLVPPFHFFVIPVLAINLINSVYSLVRSGLSLGGLFSLLVALALVLGFFFARVFATSVQDRVIRLEEQLRYERLLPQDLRSRMSEFTMAQYASLRFASDAELPELARKVLNEKLNERKAIKRLIKNWKPDYARA